ncbi:hypothetical protein D9758_008420 [Tetrapyrgos nigripes]|uniref:Uncharacterized protein n=1 Tax=Tetrapyrgos nigripes TaxID=182062 RepID=A0A8H5CNY0_9AGAR|nr:hypothetical protein D9758_008420 [Tetrapyrgos nigripes]
MSSTQKPDNAGQYRRPAYANWPTIKLTQPPAGRYSPKTDEWFFLFCTQSVRGRIHNQDPKCRSFSIRKIMPHEVRNVDNFVHHRNVDADGKARYPLPPEGQPENVPRIFGGRPPVVEDDDDEDEDEDVSPLSTKTAEKKYWEEGYYFWTTNSPLGSFHALMRMKYDLGLLHRADIKLEKDRARWLEYRQFLERNSITDSGRLDQIPDGSKWLSLRPPSRPIPDTSKHALLIPVPPVKTPFWERIDKLLEPSRRMLSIFSDSITSGDQKKFALRAWEKTWSGEPIQLAKRTVDRVTEMWKDIGDEDD